MLQIELDRTPDPPISEGGRLNNLLTPHRITMLHKNRGRAAPPPGGLFHSPPDQQQLHINTQEGTSTVDGGANDQTSPTHSTGSLGGGIDNSSGEGDAGDTGMCSMI